MKKLSTTTLNAYLFTKSKFSHWNKKVDQLIFGVECEYLIQKRSSPHTFIKRQEATELYNQLVQKFEYKLRDDESLRLGKETRHGYVSIKPDFAFHILEISYPPAGSLRELREMLDNTIYEIDSCLDMLGLQRSKSSVVQNPRVEFDLVNTPRLSGYLDQFSKNSPPPRAHYYPIYPALIAATQVHLNISQPDIFPRIKAMYELEWLVAAHFSHSKIFNEKHFGCIRPILYEDSMGPGYHLKTIPDPAPSTIHEYTDLFNKSERYFPNDPFFPVRDLTFIRPRPFGSIEFRSACSQPETTAILKLCAFRAAQAIYGEKFSKRPLKTPKETSKSALFRRAYRDAIEISDYEAAALERLSSITGSLPKELRDFVIPLHAEVKAA